jgi:DNA-binding response OmpR family regulator
VAQGGAGWFWVKRFIPRKPLILSARQKYAVAGAAENAVPAYRRHESYHSRMTDQRPRLLLVEDEATISVALGRLLDRWGFDTLAARTVAEAQALLSTIIVDVVAIDYRLPDMRGDDFLEWLQQEYPDLAKRSLFITGDYGEDALATIEGTGRPYLLKPFELGLLVHELRALLDPLGGPKTNGHSAVQNRSDITAA